MLKGQLLSVFKAMKSMGSKAGEGGDVFFETNVPIAVASFVSTKTVMVLIPPAPPIQVPIPAIPSLMQAILSPAIKAMKSGNSSGKGDKILADAIAEGVDTMSQAGASSVTGIFVGSPNVPSMASAILGTFERARDDDDIAGGIADAVETYLSASGAT